VTALTKYTPTLTEGGIAAGATEATEAFWRRVGDTLEVKLVTTFASCAQGGQVNWSLPDGVLTDPAKATPGETMGGGVGFGPDTSNLVRPGIMTKIGSVTRSAVSVDLSGAGAGGASCASVGAGGVFRLTFHTPIQGGPSPAHDTEGAFPLETVR
jgi:hypothetical protein